MTTISLTCTEAGILQAAAMNEGCVHFAPTMRRANCKRLIARFL